MSECMTIDDIKKDDTNQSGVENLSAARDVVGSILEEAFHSAVGGSDRDCMIGDFTEDFSQQFGQVSLYHSEGNSSEELIKNLDTSKSINVGSPDEKKSEVKEYKVIDDSNLENNELCFENGQIHIIKNNNVKKIEDLRSEYFSKEDIIKDEKIEIEYFNGENYNKIYVPIKKENSGENIECDDKGSKEKMSNEEMEPEKIPPFNPVTSEELRQSILQVWENVNPTAAAGWDGDMFKQPDEVAKMMEKLTNLQILSNDPNRPRAYTLAEEEVKRMIKEIEEINFNQITACSENTEASFHVIGQGDYEAELDGTPEVLSNYITFDGSKIVGEEIFISDQKGRDSSHVDLGLDASTEIKNFEETYLQQDCDWIPEREISSADSFTGDHPVHFSNSLGLAGVHINPDCAENLVSGVFASQKFNETYDFNLNDGIIGMPLALSNEDFIDNSESVIQVIDSNEEEDEESGEISFSLLNELELRDYYKNQNSNICDYDFPIAMNSERKLRDTAVVDPRRVKSGMTTVGPMKNLDHDPRDLTGPEIDFGKMTIITGSEELTKEMYSCNKSTSTYSKNAIVDESDDDENVVISDGRYVAITSLVNHDIASLTKLQKIREVISHHPRSVQDITDETVIGRDRLDLKDIENVSDDRYKELSLPLIAGLEMEPSETRSDEIDILQSIPLVVKGSRDIAELYEENSLKSTDSNRNIRIYGRSSPEIPEHPDEKLLKAQSAKTILKSKKDDTAVVNFMDGTQKDMETRFTSNTSDDRQEPIFHFNNNVQSDSMVNKKHNTLSNVFRKASNKFMRKDSDSFLRNAKSLPRDTSKLHFGLSGAESIKSLIDDCQNSAANVIKKSRSLLKNTQSLFKTISHTRFSDENSMEKRKSTSCDVALNTEDARPSTCPKEEEKTQSKTSIKSKIMKTFKSSENIGTSDDNRIVPREPKKLSLVLKNCKDYRVEKIEKVRKLLPKGSLFFKSQENAEEVIESGSNEEACGSIECETVTVGESVEICVSQLQREADGSFNTEAEIADTTYSAWIGDRGDIQLPMNRLSENSSMEEENFEWDFEEEVKPEKPSDVNQVDKKEKSEDSVSNTTVTLKNETLKDENLPPTEISDTDKASSHSLVTDQEPEIKVKTPDQSEIEIHAEPNIKPEEMVEVPLNETEGANSEVKLERRIGLEDLEMISSVETEDAGEKIDIPKKWSSPVTVDLKETPSRGSIKNKDKDKSLLSGNNSEIKKRKKNKKLSTRIRSFWLSTFGKAKSPVKKQDAS